MGDRPRHRVTRRTFLRGGAALLAVGGLLRDALVSEAAPAKCGGLGGSFGKVSEMLKTPSLAEPDESNPGKLMKQVLMEQNTDYYEAGQIYMWERGHMIRLIRREKATARFPIQWEYGASGQMVPISRCLRLAYLGVPQKGAKATCSPEHILLGYQIEDPMVELSSTEYYAWQTAGLNFDLEVLGTKVVDLLSEEGDSYAPKLWTDVSASGCDPRKICKDENEREWSFRGQMIRVDRAVTIPYAVTVKVQGTAKVVLAHLYVGYEGGAGY